MESHISNLIGKKYTIPDDFKNTKVRAVLKALVERWKKKKSHLKNFLNGNEEWLEKTVTFPNLSKRNDKNKEVLENGASKKPKLSPEFKNQKIFGELSTRSKNRLSKEHRESNTAPEVDAYAAAIKFRKLGNKNAYLVLNDIASNPLTAAKAYRDRYLKQARSLTPEQAVAYILDCKLSKNDYQLSRNNFVEIDNEGFPPYYKVLEAKKACYPENISIKGHQAKVLLQSLCNHTAEQLCKYLDVVINQLSRNEYENLKLYFKYGSDGSSSQSNYKQQFIGDNGDSIDDSSVYVSSLVPIQLVTVTENNIEKIIWMNNKPSSPMYCRPISIKFTKETTDYIIEVENNLKIEIENLKCHNFINSSANIKVHYEFISTMYDVKSINAITEIKYTKQCYICGLKNKDLGDIDKTLNTPIKKNNLKYGISSLHAWIRCFECLVNLSYKMSICQHEARESDGTKDIAAKYKRYIQEQFKTEMNLIVDQPKQVSGNSNDGNTARIFFNIEEKAARVTGIDIDIIRRFHIILQTLSSGHIIDHTKYKEYAVETAQLLKQKYSWFQISPTVHKVLLHGAEIIEDAAAPIGLLSEEAAEATNKYVRQFRLSFTRKCDREKSMNDLLCRLLANSDPFIANLRHSYKKPLRSLNPEARQMLKPPEINEKENELNESETFEIEQVERECDLCFDIEE